MDALYIEDLSNVQAASPYFEDAITNKFGLRFIQAINHHFALDPVFLMSQLQQCRAIIGGLVPLRMANHNVPMPDRLEIFTDWQKIPQLEREPGQYCEESRVTGQAEIGSTLGFKHFGQHVESVTKMTHATSGRVILIIECYLPPVTVLTTLPSTLLMNFVSSDGWYSLYPWHTSQQVGLKTTPLCCATSCPSIPAIQELEDMGFTHPPNVADYLGDHACRRAPECPLTERRFPNMMRKVPRVDLRKTLGLEKDDSAKVAVMDGDWRLRTPGGCKVPADALGCEGFQGYYKSDWGRRYPRPTWTLDVLRRQWVLSGEPYDACC